ncbi:MAG TPA: phage tail protein [Zoogloea sp.]|jgi:phage tail-like protein|uniref:phage tail protein n=1 Tax=Zoogloea sp. TaxID=49181 RepID=UPI001B5705A4|nr:phage tail protein [Zoogloea sp.]MBP8266468.1 phage tail protein [Zoogloea sp.]HOB47100.1 phage tail protein [Zoogloea sp.]HQA10338.1 phage tail protein [Zoogloea sp.]
MATLREDPYGPFNFKVTISPASGGEFRGGFSDVSGLSTEITHADYREGTDAANRPRKVPLMYKAGDVTLKRGMIASLDLWNWVNQVRRGNMDARATVVIQLLSEDHAATVASWKLINARPSKWTGPTLAAKGASDVAMEELTLVCEDLEFE